MDKLYITHDLYKLVFVMLCSEQVRSLHALPLRYTFQLSLGAQHNFLQSVSAECPSMVTWLNINYYCHHIPIYLFIINLIGSLLILSPLTKYMYSIQLICIYLYDFSDQFKMCLAYSTCILCSLYEKVKSLHCSNSRLNMILLCKINLDMLFIRLFIFHRQCWGV